jgi:hypothetical protein
MHRGYNLQTNSSTLLDAYYGEGKSIHEANKAVVDREIKSFKGRDGKLDASKIVANWFPDIEAQVFISHSHKDNKQAVELAGWLHSKFGIKSFIDSGVWGYSDDLLKLINDEYCRGQDGSYLYEKINRASGHVHMMLTTALSRMINNCECIIFMNTPNSISAKSFIQGGGSTDSPWIYSEISMTSLIQKRSPSEHRKTTLRKSLVLEAMLDSVPVRYDIDLRHLTTLSMADLTKWGSGTDKGSAALDRLYNLKP